MTVPFGTDIVCGCSILLFGCKLFGTRVFLLSVNGLGLAAPTLTVRLCLLWSIWLDSTPAGRKNSKFNTRSVVQCLRNLFIIYIYFHLYSLFVSRIDFPPTPNPLTETASLCDRSPWRFKAPSTRNRVKKTCGFKAVVNPDLPIRGGGLKKIRGDRAPQRLPWIRH